MTEKAAITWVQDYLSRRPHSEKELTSKLLKKGFEIEEIQAALIFAKERKWLEDPFELSERVYREWDLKNKSHSWIANYLSEKGLPCEQRRSVERESQKVGYLLKKKFGIVSENIYQRAGSQISSKGFNYEEFKRGWELCLKRQKEQEE